MALKKKKKKNPISFFKNLSFWKIHTGVKISAFTFPVKNCHSLNKFLCERCL